MNTFKNLSDTALVTLIQKKFDAIAYGEIYTRYNQKVFLYCAKILQNREDAMDLTQEIFILIAKKIGQIQDPQAFVKWMFRIAYNECIDLLKKKKREFSTPTEKLFHLEETPFDLEAAELKENALNQLEAVMKQLPEDERVLLQEKYFEKKTINELVEKYGMTPSAIKMRLSRSRKKIENLFGEPSF